jgi:hypothetical protein
VFKEAVEKKTPTILNPYKPGPFSSDLVPKSAYISFA